MSVDESRIVAVTTFTLTDSTGAAVVCNLLSKLLQSLSPCTFSSAVQCSAMWLFTLAVRRDILPASPMVGLSRKDFRVKDGGRRKVVATPAELNALRHR